MKRTIAYLVGLGAACVLVTGAAFAGDPDMPPPFVFSNVTTGSVASVTNDSPIAVDGWVEAIVVDLSGASSPTVDVDVVTVSSDGLGVSRTILSIDDITADAVYPVRDIAATTAGVDISNVPVKIPLLRSLIRVTMQGANVTNINAKVYVVESNVPGQ